MKTSTALWRLGIVTVLAVCIGISVYHFLLRPTAQRPSLSEDKVNIFSAQSLESILPRAHQGPFDARYMGETPHLAAFASCLNGPLETGRSTPVRPIIDVSYQIKGQRPIDRNAFTIEIEYARLQQRDINSVKSAIQSAPPSCQGPGTYWDPSSQNYSRDTETRIYSAIGDASVEYRATSFHLDAQLNRVGPGYGINDTTIFAVSRDWYVEASMPTGQQRVLDTSLSVIFRALDRRLGARFLNSSKPALPGRFKCGTPSTRSSNGVTYSWNPWMSKITLLHDAACRSDYLTLASDMSLTFTTDQGSYPPLRVIQAWRDNRSAAKILNTIKEALESPGIDQGVRVVYRAGDSSVVFTKSDGAWSAFIESCSEIPRSESDLCGRTSRSGGAGGHSSDCGLVSTLEDGIVHITVVKGDVTCSEARRVVYKDASGSLPVSGSSGLTTFEQWTCSRDYQAPQPNVRIRACFATDGSEIRYQ